MFVCRNSRSVCICGRMMTVYDDGGLGQPGVGDG